MIAGVVRLCLSLLIVALAGLSGVVGMERELGEKLRAAFEAGELSGLHSVLVVHKGEIVAESHFKGEDERWGSSLGERVHGQDTLHDLRSVTKSIVSLLHGIALSEGRVPGLDERLIDHFPEYADLAKDPERRKILVRHALSMKMGTEWNEDLPYSDPKNSEIAMELARDRYRFVLDRPMVNEPGDWWVYNGGATAVIAKLIADGAGKPVDTYAEEKLFKPLGITKFEWIKGGDDVPSAASGLRLNIHDLAKIGQLVLQDGSYEGKRIVPAHWLDASFTPYSNLQSGLRYGLFWWLSGEGSPPNWSAGFGNGGQRLTISKGEELVLVVFAGNYNDPDAWKLPVKIITEFVIPTLFPGKQ
ncbi:MAG: serine hydrolase domain-containing protein [Hyphomicrobiaceae bacterium]